MAIGSSDVFKHSVDLGVSSQSQHANTERFAQEKANEAKTVTSLANSNKTSSSSDQEQLNLQQNPYNELREKPTQKQEGESIDMRKLLDTIDGMAQLNIKLSFDISDVYKENIVKVVDQGSGEIVRQIPTEEFLAMSEHIRDLLKELGEIKGALVNREV